MWDGFGSASDRVGIGLGSVWDGLGSVWDRFGVGLGSALDGCGVGLSQAAETETLKYIRLLLRDGKVGNVVPVDPQTVDPQTVDPQS